MKKVLLLTFVLILFLLSACQSTPTQSKSWEKDGVQVKVVEPLDTFVLSSPFWADPGSYNMRDSDFYFVSGVIKNVQEVEIKFDDKYGDEVVDYFTIFDFKIDKLFSNHNDITKNARVSSLLSSRFYDATLKTDVFTNGKEYILLLKQSEDEYVIKKSGTADYGLMIPPIFMLSSDASEEQIANAFEPFTSELNTNAVVEKYKATPPKSIDDFKKFLREYFK